MNRTKPTTLTRTWIPAVRNYIDIPQLLFPHVGRHGHPKVHLRSFSQHASANGHAGIAIFSPAFSPGVLDLTLSDAQSKIDGSDSLTVAAVVAQSVFFTDFALLVVWVCPKCGSY